MNDKSGFQHSQDPQRPFQSHTEDVQTQVTIDRDLIEMALQKSPSGGNSKPFHWSWNEETLTVIHNTRHAEHYLNRNQHTSWIALGCLIESVEVAAKAQGLTVQIEVTEELSAILTFAKANSQPGTASAKLLIKGVQDRITYRGGFRASEKPVFATEDSGSVKVHIVGNQELTAEFKKYMRKTENYLWLQTKATEAFFGEVRFFDPRKEERGIRSKDLGVSIVDQVLLWLLSFVPWMLSLLVRVPVLNTSFKQAAKRNLKNAHYLLITAEVLDPISLIQVGKDAMKAWLNLEAKVYKLQPCSTATIPLVDAETNHLPADTLKAFRKMFTITGPQVLKQQFQLSECERPVWIFRVGKP